MKIVKRLKLIFPILLSFLVFSSVLAEDTLPEVMVGQAYVFDSNTTKIYGGFTGNEAVLNYGTSGQALEKDYKPSLHFDGYDDRITIPSSSNLVGTSGSITISIWIKPEEFTDQSSGDGGSSHWLYGNRFGITGSGYCWVNAHTSAESAGVYGKKNFSLNPPIRKDEWNHIVITFSDANNGTIIPYLNGVKQTVLTNKGILNPNAGSISIGSAGSSSWAGKGFIDDFRLYDKALSAAEVIDLYEGTFSNNDKLLGYWEFKEGSGTKVTDSAQFLEGTINLGSEGNTDLNNSWSLGLNEGPTTKNVNESDLVGFDQENLAKCTNSLLFSKSLDPCFVSNTRNGSMKVMSSKTYINSKPITELAALVQTQNIIAGDVYGMDPNNFAYWGRNLHQISGSTLPTNSDASWKVASSMNQSAQANWDGPKFNSYINKIKTLKLEGSRISNRAQFDGLNWVLNNTSILPPDGTGTLANTTVTNSDALYPEGRIWYANCAISSVCNDTSYIQFNSSHAYKGKGTLIFEGNLNFGENVKIKKSSTNPDSRLGIIVIGNVTFFGSNDIDAAVFATGTINIKKNNNKLTGSFVARNFTIDSTNNNMQIFYDYGLDSAWPPGFKYFDMPTAKPGS